MTKWITRAYDDVPGKPFGWAYYRAMDELRAHLRMRHPNLDSGVLGPAKLDARARRILERIHKNRPTYAERSRRTFEAPRVRPFLTDEELRHLADLFDGANDPLSASIAAKISAYFI
jgi:hypothetical protein